MTATARSPRRVSERDFMRQVTDLAELRGWSWVHFRPGQTSKGWRTPVSGPLGYGWPDLVLIRTTSNPRRLIFAEVKSDTGRQTVEQIGVLEALDDLHWTDELRGVEVYIWRPQHWDWIERALA